MCSLGPENEPAAEPRKLCGTFPVLSSRIPDIPSPPHVGSFAQIPGDCGLGDISSSHLRLRRRAGTGMQTVPHPGGLPDCRSACMPHWVKHLPGASPPAGQPQLVPQHVPFQGRLPGERCADRHDENSRALELKHSFSLSIQEECSAGRCACGQHPLPMVRYVDCVYFTAI